jgi:hypothetical protein
MDFALHVSGVTTTHHQETIQLYLQHLVFVTPLLLSAAIVEELELQVQTPPRYWNMRSTNCGDFLEAPRTF